MRIRYDRGTLLLEGVPPGLDPETLPDVVWDPRVGAHRAPAWRYPLLTTELRARAIPFEDAAPGSPWHQAGAARWEAPSLRPYQAAALAAWRAAGRRGVVVLPTGGGKTRIALAALAEARVSALCVVPTRALLRQWAQTIARHHRGPVGRWGDGEHLLAQVTVATMKSALRHMAAWGNRFGLVVLDEVHHFGQTGWDELLELCLAPWRLGLTATPPGPGPAAERLAERVGPQVFRCDQEDLAGRYLAPLDRYTLVLDLTPPERSAYELEVGAFRAVFWPFCQARPDASFGDFLAHARTTDEGRRAVAAWHASRRLLGFTEAKASALRQLLARLREHRLLLFTADNETAYRIAREHLIMPITCDIGRREREQALERFRRGELRALVSTRVLNEGLDLPAAEVGIIVGGTHGVREYVQRVGRLLRPGPDKRAAVYELCTRATPEMQKARKRETSLGTLVTCAP